MSLVQLVPILAVLVIIGTDVWVYTDDRQGSNWTRSGLSRASSSGSSASRSKWEVFPGHLDTHLSKGADSPAAALGRKDIHDAWPRHPGWWGSAEVRARTFNYFVALSRSGSASNPRLGAC